MSEKINLILELSKSGMFWLEDKEFVRFCEIAIPCIIRMLEEDIDIENMTDWLYEHLSHDEWKFFLDIQLKAALLKLEHLDDSLPEDKPEKITNANKVFWNSLSDNEKEIIRRMISLNNKSELTEEEKLLVLQDVKNCIDMMFRLKVISVKAILIRQYVLGNSIIPKLLEISRN